MGPRWYERAVEKIESDYAEGLIDYGTFHNAMRDLNLELQDAASEAAREAYDDYVGRR